jgi:hypothetical protein
MNTAMTSYGWWVRAYPKERRRIWSEQILRMLLATGTIIPLKQSMLETKKIVKTITLVTTQESKHATTTTEETQTVWANVPVIETPFEISQKPLSWLLHTRFQLASEAPSRLETKEKTHKKRKTAVRVLPSDTITMDISKDDMKGTND